MLHVLLYAASEQFGVACFLSEIEFFEQHAAKLVNKISATTPDE